MKLADYLLKNGVSQAAFAKMIDESPQNVGRYVKGERVQLDPEIMRKIFHVTGGLVTANDFYDLPVTSGNEPPSAALPTSPGRAHG